ncbi:MAG: 3-phosphoserine/phosphohydroxythreonine transaminase [Candidatus Eisenbacteria bacterium]|uniref:Phosphoserine aminotransferase n=1 Tax=Eiseniibacteriota bacterium TaxID=2212470 RepID=A0A937X9Y9_UNCEI|nr:3-phosphoserine/phosphohydroxythreonine transaminase [Candidatus Eisenbacteria bacterium]
MARAHNFFAGPAVLPLPALERAQQELVDWAGTGTSIMETSHRSKEYEAVHNEAIALIREFLSLGENYHVLFLGGGASLQFAMVPMNLLAPDQTADYVHTGTWSKKAIAEAKLFGRVNVAFDGETVGLTRIPRQEELKLTPGARYVHITSNNTIKGTQWHAFPETAGVPLVADMSSDFLWRAFDPKPFGLIYVGAQKNLGPAGVTIVLIRDDILAQCKADNPTMLKYATHAKENSLFNTPPVFAIYMVRNVLAHMKEMGGMPAVEAHNRRKAGLIYETIDADPEFFRAPVDKASRSMMNIVFRLPSEELETKFVAEGKAQRMLGLKGHRSVGGIRISAYNSCPLESVEAVVGFMKAFAKANG